MSQKDKTKFVTESQEKKKKMLTLTFPKIQAISNKGL